MFIHSELFKRYQHTYYCWQTGEFPFIKKNILFNWGSDSIVCLCWRGGGGGYFFFERGGGVGRDFFFGTGRGSKCGYACGCYTAQKKKLCYLALSHKQSIQLSNSSDIVQI